MAQVFCLLPCIPGGKEDDWMLVGVPVLAEQLESGLGQRHVPVFGTFASMDMDDVLLSVNI